MTNRPTASRASEARARLTTDANVWVATASADGLPHMVPLSLAWLDDQIIVATPTNTLTVSNILSNGRARAALDSADDVVILDADVAVIDFDAAEPALIARYVERVGWDPRNIEGAWSLLLMTPRRGQAWNGPSEIHGRIIIRNGQWADS